MSAANPGERWNAIAPSRAARMSLGDLTKYAYVRYAEAAVEHLFAVASGLDSAVIGEQQVLGQVRRAYAAAEANHTVGRTLHELSQRALSVGKRVHSGGRKTNYTARSRRYVDK